MSLLSLAHFLQHNWLNLKCRVLLIKQWTCTNKLPVHAQILVIVQNVCKYRNGEKCAVKRQACDSLFDMDIDRLPQVSSLVRMFVNFWAGYVLWHAHARYSSWPARRAIWYHDIAFLSFSPPRHTWNKMFLSRFQPFLDAAHRCFCTSQGHLSAHLGETRKNADLLCIHFTRLLPFFVKH